MHNFLPVHRARLTTATSSRQAIFTAHGILIFCLLLLSETGCVSTKQSLRTGPPIQLQDPPRLWVASPYKPVQHSNQVTNVLVSVLPAEICVQKNRGPTTLDFLLDYELQGDLVFEAWVEFATPEELGQTSYSGGTPVPYFGLRATDGRRRCYFNLGTYHPKGQRYHILLRKEGAKVAADIYGKHMEKERYEFPNGGVTSLPTPEYICFMMNDVARVRLHYVRLESPPGKVLLEYGTQGNQGSTPHP